MVLKMQSNAWDDLSKTEQAAVRHIASINRFDSMHAYGGPRPALPDCKAEWDRKNAGERALERKFLETFEKVQKEKPGYTSAEQIIQAFHETAERKDISQGDREDMKAREDSWRRRDQLVIIAFRKAFP